MEKLQSLAWLSIATFSVSWCKLNSKLCVYKWLICHYASYLLTGASIKGASHSPLTLHFTRICIMLSNIHSNV